MSSVYDNRLYDRDGYKNVSKKMSRCITDQTIKCKCGHSVFFTYNMDRLICTYCGEAVYRTKEIEFKYKLKEAQNRANKKLFN